MYFTKPVTIIHFMEMLTLPRHRIEPLIFPGAHVCPTVNFDDEFYSVEKWSDLPDYSNTCRYEKKVKITNSNQSHNSYEEYKNKSGTNRDLSFLFRLYNSLNFILSTLHTLYESFPSTLKIARKDKFC